MSEIRVTNILGENGNSPVNFTQGINMSGIVTATAFVSDTPLSNRNIIINGAMSVAQRGTSVAWASNDYLTCDRWHHTINNSAGRFTSKQTADSPDGLGGKCLELDVTTADTSIASNEHAILAYRFEGQDVQQLAKGTAGAKKFTISFYVRGNGNATYMCEFFDRTNTRLIRQQFSVTSSWSRVTLTFNNETSGGTINNDNSHEFDLQIWLHAGSDFTSGSYTANTWSGQTNANRAVGISSLFSSTDNFLKITGVQLEVGPVSTPFEHRSIGDELALCKRYYQQFPQGPADAYGPIGSGRIRNATNAHIIVSFPEMRSSPTVTKVGNLRILHAATSTAVNSVASSHMARNIIFIEGIVSSGLTQGEGCIMTANNDSTGKITLASEL